MKNNYIIQFSGENLNIALAELRSIEKEYNDFHIIFTDKNIAIIEGEYIHITNAAFSNYISLVIDSNQSYGKLNARIPDGRFYVRVDGASKNDTEKIESEIGRNLGGQGRISFKNPDFIIKAILVDQWYLCILKYERNKKYFENRRAPLRPFFSPVSLHPKYARYLVNASGTVEGDTLLDPFCGTGGVLIEAAMLKRKIIGNDSSLNMVVGTKLNFKYYRIEDYEIFNKDISKLELRNKVDGIATDMPYGRSSGIDNHGIEELYMESFKKFHELLKDNKNCSIIINNTDYLKFADPYFENTLIIPVYQHKSLTRYFVVLKKL
ncbi:MAG: methyltransferase [Ferroplasma sp.]